MFYSKKVVICVFCRLVLMTVLNSFLFCSQDEIDDDLDNSNYIPLLRKSTQHELQTLANSDVKKHSIIIKQNNYLYCLPGWSPMAGIQFLGLSQNIYTRWLLTRMSSEEIAVAELKGPSQDFFYMLGTGLMHAVEDLTAFESSKLQQAKTTGDSEAIALHIANLRDIYSSGHILGFLTMIPVTIGMQSFAPTMIYLGYNSELYEQIGDFYKYYNICVPFMHFCFVAENFIVAEGNSKNALLMALLTLGLCVVDYAFIDGSLRFQNLFDGMAVSEVVKAVVYSSIYFMMLRKNERYKTYELTECEYTGKTVLNITKTSFPIFFQRVFTTLKPMIYLQFILPDDPVLLASTALIEQIIFPGQILINSIGRWLNIELKEPTNDKYAKEVISLGNKGMIHSQTIALLLAVSLILFPDHLASIFIDTKDPKNTKVMNQFSDIINLQLLDFCISSIGGITSWALRGIGHAQKATYSEFLSSFLVGLPLSYYLVHSYDYGLWGGVMGLLVGDTLNATFLQYIWWTEIASWKKDDVSNVFWGTKENPSKFGKL